MKKVQRFIGVGDSKPASALLSTSPGNSYLSSGIASNQYTSPGALAASSTSYDAATKMLLPPSQSGQSIQSSSQQSQYGSRQVSPQSSQTLLRSAHNSPQPYSPSAQQQYFDLPTRGVSPTPGATQAPVSPLAQGLPTPSASGQPLSSDLNLVERPDLHKSLKALESLLVNLDEYRDLSARLAKVEKKLAKSASELERTKVVLDTPAQTLQVSSAMFEGLADVSSRHAKHVQKEYEAVNDACAKYFKKVAKEERAHDELVQNLDAKIKKANAAHEKNVKKATGNKALESHDKYIATVQTLTNDISRAKNAHAASMAAKSHVSSLLVASTLGGLADVEFKRRCESVRRVGPHVGRLNELLCFTSSEFMPALQASELEEAEKGQAEYLASLAAQVDAQVAAQAQVNAKINEDTQTILRAQEMGWRPPSPLAPPVASFANLGRSSSINSNVSRITDNVESNGQPIAQVDPSKTATANELATVSPAANVVPVQAPQRQLQQQSEREASRSQPSSSSAIAQTASIPLPADSDAASIHSIATDKTPRPNANSSSQPHASGFLNTTASVRLDRAPTGSTMKSMAVQPQTWEDAPISSSSSSVSRIAPSAHDRDRTGSSAREGSVVDKLAVPREDSDAVPPSLSASNSAQGSEDGNRIPRTPDDSEAVPSMQGERSNSKPQQSNSKDAGILDYRNAQAINTAPNADAVKPSATSPTVRPAQRALEQYREQYTKPVTSPTATRFERDPVLHSAGSAYGSSAQVDSGRPLDRSESVYSSTSQQSVVTSAEQANARKISLWERERERMRQLEREEELAASRTPMSATAELSYSRPHSAIYPNSTTSSHNNGGWSRSKMSEGGASERGTSSQLGLGYPRPSGADRHDLDRYAPAVGSTKLSAVGVTRSLSTDTTASERSFVARMKARYQAEKEIEREHRELNVLEKERAARRATMDPNLSLPSLGEQHGRVPQIAQRYQMSGAAAYAQEVSSRIRYHDSLPANAHSGGGMSRTSAASSAPSAASIGVDEFGGIVRDGRSIATLPTSGRSVEPPHSDVCGCHQCSARHYGSGSTTTDNSDKNAARAGVRGDPREYNVRRTSMPVPPRSDSYMQQPQAAKRQQPTYGSSPPRGSQHDAYSQQQAHAYRHKQQQQQHLNAPTSGRDNGMPRRSYEDLIDGPSSRRVLFAHEPQTIR